jgi:hypothetical protein
MQEPTDQQPQRSARIEKVQLINKDSTTRRFVLKIETDGSVTYEETHVVAPATKERIPVITDGLPKEEGNQVVSVEVVDTGERESVTFESDTCFSVLVEYSAAGVGIFSASGSEQCRSSD